MTEAGSRADVGHQHVLQVLPPKGAALYTQQHWLSPTGTWVVRFARVPSNGQVSDPILYDVEHMQGYGFVPHVNSICCMLALRNQPATDQPPAFYVTVMNMPWGGYDQEGRYYDCTMDMQWGGILRQVSVPRSMTAQTQPPAQPSALPPAQPSASPTPDNHSRGEGGKRPPTTLDDHSGGEEGKRPPTPPPPPVRTHNCKGCRGGKGKTGKGGKGGGTGGQGGHTPGNASSSDFQ